MKSSHQANQRQEGQVNQRVHEKNNETMIAHLREQIERKRKSSYVLKNSQKSIVKDVETT